MLLLFAVCCCWFSNVLCLNVFSMSSNWMFFLLSIPLIFALCFASPHHHHHHMIIASIPAFLFTFFFCFLLLHFLFVLSDVDEIMKIQCLLKEFFLFFFIFFFVKFKGKLEIIYGNQWGLMDALCFIFL